MASNPTLILTLSQVIDAALQGPELGLVSYTLLNNILQVICQQLNLQDLKLQYKGTQAKQLKRLWDPDIRSKVPTVSTVKKTSITSSVSEGAGQKLLVFPDDVPEKYPSLTLAVSREELVSMNSSIKHLQEEFEELKEFPLNEELYDSIKEKQEAGVATKMKDMYKLMQLTKRVEAVEKITSNMAGYVEHLTEVVSKGETLKRTSFTKKDSKKSPDIKHRRISEIKTDLEEDQGENENIPVKEKSPLSTILESESDIGNNEDEDYKEKGGYDEEAAKLSVQRDIEELAEKLTSQTAGIDMSGIPTVEGFKLIQADLISLRQAMKSYMKKMSKILLYESKGQPSEHQPSTATATTTGMPKGMDNKLQDKMRTIEKKLNECVSEINKLDSSFTLSYSGIVSRIAGVESAIKALNNKILQDVGKEDIEEQLAKSIYTINDKIEGLEAKNTKLTENISALTEGNIGRDDKFKSIDHLISVLKTDKIGREEFGEALADKVDLCMINRKVSHDQFNATCEDLSKGIEEALEKLIEQEGLWNVALMEIQNEISDKLGKDELDPLKNFVTQKLKGLQQRVRALARMKAEQEAAGAKSKYIRGIQCISCDNDVVMRKKLNESLHYAGAPTLPSHKNMAPQLAYELDQLRKQQQYSHYSRNMQHFNSAVTDKKESVNRYCGGLHTITTPQQRVTRVGNFVEQWGPKAVQLEEAVYRPDGTYRCIKADEDTYGVALKSKGMDTPERIDKMEVKDNKKYSTSSVGGKRSSVVSSPKTEIKEVNEVSSPEGNNGK